MTGRDEVVTDTMNRRRHSLDLRGSSPRTLAQVRQWIVAQLSWLGRAHVEDVVQVADELAANAYEHGDGPRAIHLIHQQDRGQTTVEVDDSSSAAPTLGH